MKNGITHLITLLIGLGIGYFLKIYLDKPSKPSGEKLEFIGNSSTSKISDDHPIDPIAAQTRINGLQTIISKNPESVANLLLKTQKWVVDAHTLGKIIFQKNTNDNSCESVIFYPALTVDGKGITFVMLGSAKNVDADGKSHINLIKTQNVKQSDGSVKQMPAEIWDYIGPCPPNQNCPEDDL